MKLPWAFYLSWKQLFPTGRGVSFFSVLSVFGVALGVNVMIVVVAFMNGFQDKFRTDIIDSQGHARAEMSYGSSGDWKDDMAKLESQPKVQAVAPYLNGHLLLEHFGNRAVPLAMGVDPIRGDAVIPVSEFLAEGSPKMLAEEAFQITPLPVVDDLQDDVVFLSRQAAHKLGAHPAAAILTVDHNSSSIRAGNGTIVLRKLDPFVESGTWQVRFEDNASYRITDPYDVEWKDLFLVTEKNENLGEGIPVFEITPGSTPFAKGDLFTFEIFGASVIDVYSPAMLQKAKNDELLPPRQVRVGGIFEVPWQGFHLDALFGTLRFMQEMNDQPGVVHGFNLKFVPEVASDTQALADACMNIRSSLGENWSVVPWFVENAWFFDLLKFEEYLMVLIMVPIGLVAAFAIAIALMTSVVRKTREIGLLVAMGGSRLSVGTVFTMQGFVIGLLGTVVGWGMALLFICYRDTLMSFIVRNIAGEEGGAGVAQFYDFYSLNVPYPWDSADSLQNFLIFGAFAVGVSTLAGFLPAWKAARLNPSEALRSE